MNNKSPKKTCQTFGLDSVAELASAVNQPANTFSVWFRSKPELFQAVLIGVATQKAVAEGGYEPEKILELLNLGIQVKQDAEEMARYRAEQLIIQ